MSWGPCYFYYCCEVCGRRFKYATDLIPLLGDRFGRCPSCGIPCTPAAEGAVIPEDLRYEEIDE